CQDQMAQVDHVIGMEMGEEDVIDLARPDAGAEQLDGHTRPGIHEERLVAQAHECGRPSTRRVRRWTAGSQEPELHRELPVDTGRDYRRGAMRWTASADVMTGNTSKSTRSLPAATHRSRRHRSSHSISW